MFQSSTYTPENTVYYNNYTTQIQNFGIINKNLENRKNKYEKIIQIIFIEYYNEIHINCSNLNIRIAYFITFRKNYQC